MRLVAANDGRLELRRLDLRPEAELDTIGPRTNLGSAGLFICVTVSMARDERRALVPLSSTLTRYSVTPATSLVHWITPGPAASRCQWFPASRETETAPPVAPNSILADVTTLAALTLKTTEPVPGSDWTPWVVQATPESEPTSARVAGSRGSGA